MAADPKELRIGVSRDGSVTFDVWAKPNARKSAVTGVRGGALEVRLAAPPVDGAANDELVAFLAALLRVAERQVRLVRGASARTKSIEVQGLGLDEARARLAGEIAGAH